MARVRRILATRRLAAPLIELNRVVVGVAGDGIPRGGLETEKLLNGGPEGLFNVGGTLGARLEKRKTAVGFAPIAYLLRRN